MARLQDIKVGMKVQIVKGKEDPEDFGLKLTDCQVAYRDWEKIGRAHV